MVQGASGYTTTIGTRLHGRGEELARLASLARSRRLTIIYGPRGAGKRELTLALASTIDWADYVIVDAATGRVESSRGAPEGLVDALKSGASLGELVEAAARSAPGRLLIAIIDVDLLERYRLAPGEAGLGALAADIRALSLNLTRGIPGRGLSVILTSSNGFLGNLYVRGLLMQAVTGYMLLEGLDPGSFIDFLGEYAPAVGGCRLDPQTLHAYTGGLPGLAVELCGLARDEITEWVGEKLAAIDAAMAGARLEVSRTTGWDADAGSFIKLAAGLVDRSLKPLQAPHAYLAAESLAAKGLLYPKPVAGGVVARDPWGLLRVALEEAASKGASSLADIDPQAVLARLAGKPVDPGKSQGRG